MTQLSPPCPSCGYPAENESCGQCDGKILAADEKSTIEAGNRFFLIEIIEGFGSLFQAALSLMTDKAYIGKLKLAIVLNLVLVTGFACGIGYGFFSLIDQILTNYEWLQGWGSATIALLLALIATWFLAPSLIEVGMSPFLDPIANATERIHGGEKMQPVHLGFWRNLTAALNAASQVLMIQIFVLIPVLILGVIPLVNLVAIPVGILISAYLNAVIWLEIPIVRRGYGMRYRYQIIRRNWARALGFGLAFNLGLLVPFFNILFLAPATAVAVSSLYFRFEKRAAS